MSELDAYKLDQWYTALFQRVCQPSDVATPSQNDYLRDCIERLCDDNWESDETPLLTLNSNNFFVNLKNDQPIYKQDLLVDTNKKYKLEKRGDFFLGFKNNSNAPITIKTIIGGVELFGEIIINPLEIASMTNGYPFPLACLAYHDTYYTLTQGSSTFGTLTTGPSVVQLTLIYGNLLNHNARLTLIKNDISFRNENPNNGMRNDYKYVYVASGMCGSGTMTKELESTTTWFEIKNKKSAKTVNKFVQLEHRITQLENALSINN